MDLFITLAILVVNAIAVLIMYQFTKPLPKKERLLIIAIGMAANYMLVLFVYWLSSIGMDEKIAGTASSFITYMFVPINSIITVTFLATSYAKLKLKKLAKDKFRNRVILIIIIAILLFVLEFFYFKNIQAEVAQMVTQK